MIFGDSEAEIYGFYVAAILKPQDGCHDIIGGGGSYQKCEPKIMRSLWKKFNAFVQNIHIHLLSCLTTRTVEHKNSSSRGCEWVWWFAEIHTNVAWTCTTRVLYFTIKVERAQFHFPSSFLVPWICCYSHPTGHIINTTYNLKHTVRQRSA